MSYMERMEVIAIHFDSHRPADSRAIRELIRANAELRRALIDIRDSTGYDVAAKARAAMALDKVPA